MQLGWGSDASCALEAVPIARLMPGVAIAQICADDKSSSGNHKHQNAGPIIVLETAGGLLVSKEFQEKIHWICIDWHPQVLRFLATD